MQNIKICPYPGLRPFNENESIFFKGRDEHIEKIIRQLEQNKFIMLTGASGDGKSSLVYAGVIPNARAGFFKAKFNNWIVADFRPERDPLKNLAKVISRNLNIHDDVKTEKELSYGFSSLVQLYKSSPCFLDTNSEEYKRNDDVSKKELKKKAANLIILVDQFEEFFTNIENFSNDNPSLRAQTTVNLLLETAHIALAEDIPIYIICTMRSDYIGQCAAFYGLPEYIGFSHFFVPRLKRKEIQQVIEEPAMLSGCKISNRLTQVLINELGEGFDQLPVLQHALNQIWHEADNGNELMDMIHLAQLGGMPPQLLSEDAKIKFEEWFNGLTSDEQELLKQPSLENLLNSHANKLYFRQARIYYNQKHTREIAVSDASLIIKITFQCLTRIDHSHAVRNRMTLQEITDIINKPAITADVVAGVVDIFRIEGNTFLKPFITEYPETQKLHPDTVLDITHESLIRNWRMLNEWAKEEHNNYVTFLDFNKQLQRWIESNKSSGYFLPVGPLTFFEKWYSDCEPNKYWLKKYDDSSDSTEQKMTKANARIININDYLGQSRKYFNAIESGKKRKNRILLAASVVIIIFLSGLTIWAFKQQHLADQKRIESENAKSQAIQSKDEAEKSKLLAQQNEQDALKAKQESEKSAKEALIQKNNAVQATASAQNSFEFAKESAEKANLEKAHALTQKQIADEEKERAVISEAKANNLSEKALSQQMAYMAVDNKEKNDTLAALFAMHAYDLHKESNGEVLDPVIYNGFIQANYYLNGKECFNFKENTMTEQSFIAEANDSIIFSSGNNEGVIHEWNKLNKTVKLNNAIFLKSENTYIDKKSNSLFKEFENGKVDEYLLQVQNIKSEHQFENFGGVMRGAMPVNDGDKFLLASKSGKIYIYNNQDKNPENIIDLKEEILSFCSLDKNSCLIGTAAGNIVKVSAIGKIDRFMKDQEKFILPYSIETTKSGETVFIGSSDGRIIKVTHHDTVQIISNYQISKTIIKKLSYNEHSRVLAAIGADNKIWIIDFKKPANKPTSITFNSPVRSLYVDNKGDIFAGIADLTFRMYHSDCNKMYEELCAGVKRDLTKNEWEDNFGNNVEYKPLNCKK